MHESLEDEVLQLRKERGKQERLATSITDQMQVEAQVSLSLYLSVYLYVSLSLSISFLFAFCSLTAGCLVL